MANLYAELTSLELDRPEERILRLTLRTPGKLSLVTPSARAA